MALTVYKKETMDKYVNECKHISIEDQLKLFNQYKNSIDENEQKEIRNKFILSIIPMIYKIAHVYYRPHHNFNELINEGIVGAYYAFDKFDVSMGISFTTYSYNWIRVFISNYVKCDYEIVLNKSNHHIIQDNNIEDDTAINDEIPVIRNEKEEEAIRLLNWVLSLDEYINDENDQTFEGSLADVTYLPTTIIQHKDAIKYIMNVMDKSLSDIEKKIIVHRFGLGKSHQLNLEEISQIIGVTKQRIEQIEKQAIQKLKRHKVKLNYNLN